MIFNISNTKYNSNYQVINISTWNVLMNFRSNSKITI